MCFHIVFQISFQILQDKNYRNVLGVHVRSELLPSTVYTLSKIPNATGGIFNISQK